MVQSSSIALLATVALCAVTPSFAAPLSSTTTTTTAAAVKTPPPAPATPQAGWLGAEEKLLADLAAMQNYVPSDPKTVPNNAAQQPKKDDKKPTTPTPPPPAKPVDANQKKVNELEEKERRERERIRKLEVEAKIERERLDRERQEVKKLQNPGATTTTTTSTPPPNGNPAPAPAPINNLAKAAVPAPNPAPQQPNGLQRAEFKVLTDMERLLQYQPKASRDFDGSDMDVREEESNWVRGYDNSQNDARDFSEDSENWVRLYDDATGEARDLNLDDGNWVRGYDNSADVEFVRDDEPESFERDFDDDEFYQRNDFEELEDLE